MKIMTMFYDGKTRKGPMPLPVSAVRTLDTGETVSNLAGCDWKKRNRCGFYELAPAKAKSGFVVVSTTWPDKPDESGRFVESITLESAESDFAASVEADAAAAHEAEAPANSIENWSPREQCLMLVCFKLAKQHWPTMTWDAFLANVKEDWDKVSR